jgi:hypothetical protein
LPDHRQAARVEEAAPRAGETVALVRRGAEPEIACLAASLPE